MKNLKRFVVPLQALFALGACSGMAWMIFVIAGFNPNPPTSADLQARSTEDLSYASMNSTAAALAFDMIGQVVIPSPIILPVTGRGTPGIPTLTIAVTLKPIITFQATFTPSFGLATPIPPTATREDRERPTNTRTPVPTRTLPPPTRTNTIVPSRTITPSRTPMPPTPTDTPVPDTYTPIPDTETSIPDTNTPIPEPDTPTADTDTENQPVTATP